MVTIIRNFAERISLSNVVEIFILYIIFLVLLKFIQDTPGISVFRGFLIFGFVTFILIFFVSRQVKLAQLNFILEKWLFPWFILGLVIIFQPELRQVFNRIGQTKLFRRRAKLNIKNIEEIVEAVKWLSANKIGALIVIENEMKLNPLKEKGVKLDADINSELLKALFHKSSALHDGAVIIADKKIGFARCFLPLLEMDNEFQHLGSRHRAGICITTETDAISIIVSEETGRVSIASKGKFVLSGNIDGIKDTLTRLLLIKK